MPPLPRQVLALLVKRKCSDDDDDSSPCETGTGGFNTSMAVGVAIAVPIAFFAIILGFMLFKNYRKNKKEEKDFIEDPDFAPEETALPDFPDSGYYKLEKGILGPAMQKSVEQNQALKSVKNDLLNFPVPKIRGDNESHYSSSSDAGSLAQTIQKHPSLDSLALPFEGEANNSQYLNQYAKMLGTDYRAYSNVKSSGSSSSLTDVSSNFSKEKKHDNRNEKEDDYESSTLNDPFSSTSSPSNHDKLQAPAIKDLSHSASQNSALRNEVRITSPEQKEQHVVDEHNEDPYKQLIKKEQGEYSNTGNVFQEKSNDSIDNIQNINPDEGLAGHLPSKTVTFAQGAKTESDQYDKNLSPDNYLDIKDNRVSKYDDFEEGELTEDERENLRRMKSVYKVYFDRNNSVKHPSKEFEDEEEEEEEEEDDDDDHENINQGGDHNDDVPPTKKLGAIHSPDPLLDDAKDKRMTKFSTASSMYDTPNDQSSDVSNSRGDINQSEYQHQALPSYPDQHFQQANYSSQLQYQETYPQQQPQQQYYPQQSPSSYFPQQQPSPQQQYPMHPNQEPQQYVAAPPPPAPVKPLEPLKELPTASELGDVTNSNFLEFQASKKNQKSRHVNVKPFNPLEHSESWSPTLSPPAGTNAQFSNPLAHTANSSNTSAAANGFVVAPQQTATGAPSASAMSRSSIVMLNTVDIGAAKKYKPANARNVFVPQQQMQQQRQMFNGGDNSVVGLIPAQQPPSAAGALGKKVGNKGSQKNLRKILDDPMYK